MQTGAFSFRSWAAIALVGCLAASMVGGWTVRVSGQRGSLAARPVPRTVTPRGPLLAGEQATVDLFEKASASVVFISTQARVMDAWTRNVFSVPRGTSSGFIWDADGHIVTNRHVVAGATGGARGRSEARTSSHAASGGQDRPRALSCPRHPGRAPSASPRRCRVSVPPGGADAGTHVAPRSDRGRTGDRGNDSGRRGPRVDLEPALRDHDR